MKKKILISEEQLKRIVDTIKEGEDNQSIPQDVMDAFGEKVAELGICTMNEGEVLTEGVVDDFKRILKNGILVASAVVALGIMTPQDAQAQIGSKPNREFVKLFKNKMVKQCSEVGVQKKLTTDKSTPSRRLVVYQYKQPIPKFNDAGDKDTMVNFIKDKSGEFKEINDKQLNKFEKKFNVTNKTMSHKMAKTALR